MTKFSICAAALLLVTAVPASAIEYTVNDTASSYEFSSEAPWTTGEERSYGHFLNNACGASVPSGNLGTCAAGFDCATWSVGGRIFRDGVNQGAFCGTKGCPGGNFNPGTTMSYQAYYFNTNEDDCECISVDFQNGSCGPSVHGSLFEGVADPGPTWACNMAPDAAYMGDQGSSIAGQNFSGSTTNEHITVMAHSNFGINTSCQYSFSITCIASESLSCALAPIEAKLDMIIAGGIGTGGETSSGKVLLCHVTGDPSENDHVINVNASAVPSHEAHGDCDPSDPDAVRGDSCEGDC